MKPTCGCKTSGCKTKCSCKEIGAYLGVIANILMDSRRENSNHIELNREEIDGGFV